MNIPARSPKMSDWEWERNKVIIWHLLTDEKLPLGKIRDRLKAKGLDTTLEELKSRLRHWGFSGRTPIDVKKYITFKVRKRKQREKKRSAVVVDGRLWSLAKVQKETSRNDYTTSELMRVPNPPTPSGIMVSVCSPPPIDVTMHDAHEWPSGLPWLRFMKLVSGAQVDIIGMMARGSPAMCIASSNDFTISQAAELFGLWLRARTADPYRLSKYLQATMPEAFQGEHLLRSQCFTTRSGGASRELFIWSLYQISNSADYHDYQLCQSSKDNALLDMIDLSGLVGSKDPILAEPTVMSVLEKVWAAALRQCRCRVVSWISRLDIGFGQPACRPSGSRYRGEGSLHSPLIVTILNAEDSWCCLGRGKNTCQRKTIPIHDITAVLGVLLACGASPEEPCCLKHRKPLEFAVRQDYSDVVKIFVEHGVNIQGAGYLQKMDFNTFFCLAPENQLPRNKPGTMEYLQSLASKAFPFAESPFDTLLSPEGLTRAAREGSLTLLRALQLAGADFNCATLEGEFPLGAAIAAVQPHCRDDKQSRYKVLVGLGSSVNYEPARTVDQEVFPSALHIASAFGNKEAVEYLVSQGANQFTPARFYIGNRHLYAQPEREFGSEARSPLGWALWRCHHHCAALLLDSGAPVKGDELLTLFGSPHMLPRSHHYRLPDGLLEALIARNVDLDMQTTSGKTALDLAVLGQLPVEAGILVRAGAPSKCTTSSDFQALNQNDWREQYDWQEHYFLIAEDEPDEFLFEEWFRFFRSSSYKYPENAFLGALATYLVRQIDADPKEESISWVEFALHRFPQAYSSTALFGVAHLISCSAVSEARKLFAILNEILRRRRPEFVDSREELLALRYLVWYAISADHQRDTNVLELLPWQLLSQEPRLCRMLSHPSDNPLLGLFYTFIHSPVHTAEDEGSRQLVFKKLLESGFKVTTALGLYAISERCSVSELEQMIELGFNPRRRYGWSSTALQYAVRNQDLDVARFLLNHDVNVNAPPRWKESIYVSVSNWGCEYGPGRTALQSAAEDGNLEWCRLLVDSGADVNAPPARVGGGTALQLAAMKGYIGVVRWLLSQGANVHAQGAPLYGMTAIEGAAAQHKLDIVGLLLEHGNFSDHEGRRQFTRAVGHARREGHQALRIYLEGQIGWTNEDEETLAREDIRIVEWWRRNMDLHRDCAGDWESVSEDMDEPDCCFWEPDSSDGSQSSSESCSGDEDHEPVRYEEGQEEEAPALPYDASFEAFWDTYVLPGLDAEARNGATAPATHGMVVGEILENGMGSDGQNGQDDWMDQWIEEWANLP